MLAAIRRNTLTSKRFPARNPRMTKFLLAVAGIALSTNAALLAPATFAQSSLKPAEEAAVRAACNKVFDEQEESGEAARSMPHMNRAERRAVRPAMVSLCVLQEQERLKRERRLGVELPVVPVPTTPATTSFTRGLAALNEGELDGAIAEFTAAIADNPKDTFFRT
jgi:hypothetical protein